MRACGAGKISSIGEKAGKALHLEERAGGKHYRPVGLGETTGSEGSNPLPEGYEKLRPCLGRGKKWPKRSLRKGRQQCSENQGRD